MPKEKKENPCRIVLENVRLSFAQDLFKPGAMKNKDGTPGELRYHSNFLIPKGEKGAANRKKILEASKLAKIKTFGADEAKWPKLKANQVCHRDGDEESWEGYEGNTYVSASANAERDPKPLTKDRQNNTVDKSSGLLYSGCYVNAIVTIWAQSNEYGKRINAKLEGVQFVNHGEAFGAAPLDPDSAFRDISEEGEIAAIDSAAEEGDSPLI